MRLDNRDQVRVGGAETHLLSRAETPPRVNASLQICMRQTSTTSSCTSSPRMSSGCTSKIHSANYYETKDFIRDGFIGAAHRLRRGINRGGGGGIGSGLPYASSPSASMYRAMSPSFSLPSQHSFSAWEAA